MDRKFITISTIRNRIRDILNTYNEQQQRVQKYDPNNSDGTASHNTSSTNSDLSFEKAAEQSEDPAASIEFQSTISEDPLGYKNATNNEDGDENGANTSNSCQNDRKSVKKIRVTARECRAHRFKLKPNKNAHKKKNKLSRSVSDK